MSRECEALHRLINGLERHRFPFDDRRIPENGIYVLFEEGEAGHGEERIVRIGTHTGHGQLRSRLRQHFLTENKDRSIFRKNIGRALLSRRNDPFLEKWELDLTSRRARERWAQEIDPAYQAKVEAEVSAYIRSRFSFVAFEVTDKTDRLDLESRMISTVSLCTECGPSSGWLGRSSPKDRIAASGLWLVNELYKTPLDDKALRQLSDRLNQDGRNHGCG